MGGGVGSPASTRGGKLVSLDGAETQRGEVGIPRISKERMNKRSFTGRVA